MEKNKTIDRILSKSDLTAEEQRIFKESVSHLLKAKEQIKQILPREDRSQVRESLEASLDDSIAYLSMIAVPPTAVIARELLNLTDKTLKNIGS